VRLGETEAHAPAGMRGGIAWRKYGQRISRLQCALKAVTADLILVDSFLDRRPSQHDMIRFLLWWQALDAALARKIRKYQKFVSTRNPQLLVIGK
jgi:hypothetical protein